MASPIGPRSVNDATRFTSTVPHASSKTAAGDAALPQTPSRIPGETPEQRVQRLRQAHMAAQKAKASGMDRAIGVSRRFLDGAQRLAVGGIVAFTAIAGIVSVYSVWDMLRYNRARRVEWTEAQKKLEADALSAARVAYIKGEATEEQTALVEEANRQAEQKGTKLPPLLSPPEHRTHFEEHVQPAFQGADRKQGKGVLGIFTGLWSDKKAAGEAALPESQPASGSIASAVVQSIEAKARDVWEAEKENQRRGGSLDKLGLDTGTSGQAASGKSRWWPW